MLIVGGPDVFMVDRVLEVVAGGPGVLMTEEVLEVVIVLEARERRDQCRGSRGWEFALTLTVAGKSNVFSIQAPTCNRVRISYCNLDQIDHEHNESKACFEYRCVRYCAFLS